MTWFETLTGCREESPDQVRRQLAIDGNWLRSKANGKAWQCGKLETPTLSELRRRARRVSKSKAKTTVRELVGDVQMIHRDDANAGAMIQVASQFNLLEMTSPSVTPEQGVGIYERDFTQGPACAIAAGAGTIYRNYFASVNGRVGQTSDNQIDCLLEIGEHFGNDDEHLWKMENGYVLPSKLGLETINERLDSFDETQRDQIRGLLRIGLQLDTQVTLGESNQLISQTYCSAMPVAYTEHSPQLWKSWATLVLEAAYEATICAAIENAARTGNKGLFLTLLGGGAFGNEMDWIGAAIRRAISLYADGGLDISIVSYGRSKPAVRQWAESLNAFVSEEAAGEP